jgi:hypothetical protein
LNLCRQWGCWVGGDFEEFCPTHNTEAYQLLRQIQRYDKETRGSYNSYDVMVPDEYGDWLRYEDVEKLLNASIT